MAQTDKDFYKKTGERIGSGVADGLDKNKPLTVTEKAYQHRATMEMDCHDCGNLISKGEPYQQSNVTAEQGFNAKSHRYECHLACYDVVGRVVMILGKEKTHSFDGRPSLRQMWADHHAEINAADDGLGAMLQGAFGKP